MKFMQDELNEEIEEWNKAWEEAAHLDDEKLKDNVRIEEDYLFRLKRSHDVQCYWMECFARSMPTFNSGYRNACAPDSPVKEREDTVEFWRNVIDGAQCVLDLQSNSERLDNDEVPVFHEVFVNSGCSVIQLNIIENRECCDRFRYESKLAENNDLQKIINEIYEDADWLHEIVVAHAMILEKK